MIRKKRLGHLTIEEEIATGLLQCSHCKASFYYDAACQRRHWREHKAAGGGQAGG
jgi:hypothetical protein